MSRFSVAAARLRALFARKRLERELEDEVRFHLEMQAEHNREAGMNPEEARAAALRSFGGVEPMKESYRERRSFALVEGVAQDLRYAARTLRKSPGFTASAAAVLALAIGANTAMFSALDAVLLRPLPYPAPDRLAMLWTEMPSRNLREARAGYWTVEQWRRESRSFAAMAVFDPVSVALTGTEGAERISAARVSPELFPLLGVQPLAGRIFTAEEAARRHRLALISYRFWQTHWGGSPDALGASIELDGIPSRIIGILPAGFQFRQLDADVWEPHTMFPDWEARRAGRGGGSWFVLGRLRPQVSFEQAQAEMNAIARRLDDQLPITERGRGVSVVPLRVQLTGPRQRLALWMLAGAVFCVLLIAAANAGGLWLARSAAREREIAIRAALGAGWGRIARQLLAESLILSAASGLAGLLLALAGIRLIAAFEPGGLALLKGVQLDTRVLGAAMALCLVTGILVGLAPALTVARRSERLAVPRGGGRLTGGVAGRGMRRALVRTEFALALILLAGAGLLIRSLWLLERVELGFRPERVLSIQMAAPPFPAEAAAALRADLYERVLRQIASLPGVESAGVIENFFTSEGAEQTLTTEAGAGAASERLRFRSDAASAGFFQAAGTPLIRGRIFSAADRADAPRVAIVNEAMARRLWPGRDAVGRRFKFGSADSRGAWFTVVGVIGDMRRQGLESQPIPQMFEALAQNPPRLATLLVRTARDGSPELAGRVEGAVRLVEKRAPLYGVTTLEQRLGTFLARRRFQTALLMAFAAAALLMAAVGIYGLIQYSIAMRAHEIGIRLAVGAGAGAIFRMILGEGLRLSLGGLAIGLAGALGLSRAASSLLFGVGAADPPTFLAASLALLAVAAAACYLPARRATKLDPIAALRHE